MLNIIIVKNKKDVIGNSINKIRVFEGSNEITPKQYQIIKHTSILKNNKSSFSVYPNNLVGFRAKIEEYLNYKNNSQVIRL